MIRIWPEQMEQLQEALSKAPVDVAEAYLRKHYEDDCAAHDPADLRRWIELTLPILTLRGERSVSEVLFDLGVRWVLRDWYPSPPPPPRS